MHIYIPIIPILWGVGAYLVIGLILCPHLLIWQIRFVYTKYEWYQNVQWIRALAFSMIAWPFILVYNIKTEIDYRKKGYL